MSAFLCMPEHLAQLAIAFCNDRYEKAEPREVVSQMLAMNKESLKARYPDSFNEFVEGSWQDYEAKCIAAVSKGKDLALGWVDLYKMAQCFSYQSCENQSIWEGGYQIGHTFFNAHRCELLKDRIVSNNNYAAYEAAPWGFSEHIPRYDTAINIMDLMGADVNSKIGSDNFPCDKCEDIINVDGGEPSHETEDNVYVCETCI